MENRTITVYNSLTDLHVQITTSATTVGELLEALRENDFEVPSENFVLSEGLSHASFDSDVVDAQLPKDILYEGNVTNDLLFMISMPNKKIKSGASLTSLQLRNLIKTDPEFRAFLKQKFNNYSKASVEELNKVYKKFKKKTSSKPAQSCQAKQSCNCCGVDPTVENKNTEEIVKGNIIVKEDCICIEISLKEFLKNPQQLLDDAVSSTMELCEEKSEKFSKEKIKEIFNL